MPFPEFEGGGKAGILGGANLVISTYSKNPGGALKFIDYMTSEERQAEDVVKFSDASPLKAVYDDPAVQKAQPFSPELKSAVEQATSRPVSPVYPQISEAIYKNVNSALSGDDQPGGRAQERAGPDRPGARDVLAPRARAAVPYAGTAVRPVARTHTMSCSTSSSCLGLVARELRGDRSSPSASSSSTRTSKPRWTTRVDHRLDARRRAARRERDVVRAHERARRAVRPGRGSP